MAKEQAILLDCWVDMADGTASLSSRRTAHRTRPSGAWRGPQPGVRQPDLRVFIPPGTGEAGWPVTDEADARLPLWRPPRWPNFSAPLTTNTTEEAFRDHKDDFVDWRYVFEKQGNSEVEVLDLEPAVEAIVEEYGENMTRDNNPG